MRTTTIATATPYIISIRGLVKNAMNLGFDAPLEVGLKLEQDALGIMVATKDAIEGLSAFMQRREPVFKGK